ncbi:MAG: SpoVA/SpoVAEb family sporulation membrane protein [Erysipelotrichaceae bacterium]|nr:SpoVA/SpoVAEb family sporulation membrane protein [Erysipelotrichaceae bacterium]
MSIYRFQQINKHQKQNAHKIRNSILAFVSGGIIGLVGQLLYVIYTDVLRLSMNDANGWMIITIIFITALLTGFGVFDKIAQFCGAGTFIPITGFANALVASAMEGRTEGPIYGIGANMFKLAGSVITYGISFAILIAIVRFWVGI